ncbi:MAG: TlpA family protein disulfide reductase, partial [Candidatus Thorarchaeota archaeon]
SIMEPEKMAIVGITLVVAVVGLMVGATFLTYPSGTNNDDHQITRTTQDTDLLELGLEVPSNWEFEMSDGSTLQLSDLEGQVVLVDLMATWCSTCSTQNGYLSTIAEDLSSTVVVVSLTVDTSETVSMMADYKATRSLSWAHGVDDTRFLNYFSISSVPSMVLIDSNGFFRYFHVGLWSDVSISAKVASIL